MNYMYYEIFFALSEFCENLEKQYFQTYNTIYCYYREEKEMKFLLRVL